MLGRGGRGGGGGRGPPQNSAPPPGSTRALSTVGVGGHRDPDDVVQMGAVAAGSKPPAIKVENLSEAKLMTAPELAALLAAFRVFEDKPNENEDILRTLQTEKQRFLFNSHHLMQIVQATPSLKTKILLIESIIGRVTDPKARVADFVGLFRNSDQRQQIEELFKQRALTLDSAKLLTGPRLLGGGRGAAEGGGGRGGRGGRGLQHSLSTNNLMAPPTLSLATAPPPLLQPPIGRHSSVSMSNLGESFGLERLSEGGGGRPSLLESALAGDASSSSSSSSSGSGGGGGGSGDSSGRTERERDSLGSFDRREPDNLPREGAATHRDSVGSRSRDSARRSVDDATLHMHSSDCPTEPHTPFRPSLGARAGEDVIPLPTHRGADPIPASLPAAHASSPTRTSLATHWSPDAAAASPVEGSRDREREPLRESRREPADRDDGPAPAQAQAQVQAQAAARSSRKIDLDALLREPPVLEAWEQAVVSASAGADREVRQIRKGLGLSEGTENDENGDNSGGGGNGIETPQSTRAGSGSGEGGGGGGAGSDGSEYWERKALRHEALQAEAGERSRREVERVRDLLGLGLGLDGSAAAPGAAAPSAAGTGSSSSSSSGGSSGGSGSGSGSGSTRGNERWEQQAGVELPLPETPPSVRTSVLLREAAIAAANQRNSLAAYTAALRASCYAGAVSPLAPGLSGSGVGVSVGVGVGATLVAPSPSPSPMPGQPTPKPHGHTPLPAPHGYTPPPSAPKDKEDPRAWLDLPWEGPVAQDEQGRPLFSYRELVRRNLRNKVSSGGSVPPTPGTPAPSRPAAGADTYEMHAEGWYAGTEGLQQGSLEEHLEEGDFCFRFGMQKAAYRQLPKWKQSDLKKALSLF